MKQNRVVVTGMGTVNSIAQSVPEFFRALQAGQCGIGPVTIFDTAEYRTHNGGQVQQFAPREMIPHRFSLKRMSRADCMAMAAAVEALNDAGLFEVPDTLRSEMGVVIGGGGGGMLECEAIYRDYLLGNGRGLAYSPFASFCCASSADQIASQLKIMGPKTTFMTACSSGANAIGYARDLIQTNIAPVIICGGTEPQIPISSTKSMIGHTLGAAGAIEGVASMLAIHHRLIPPTIHRRTPDPQCDLDFVTQGARPADLNVVLSNSFAFGGNNTAVVYGKFTGSGVSHA